MSLLRQRTRARADAHRAGEALKRLASESMSLLRQAVQGPPELRRMAIRYIALLEETAGKVKTPEDAEPRA
jgi:hypothetical protein